MDIEIKRGYCYTIFWKEDSLFRRGVESVICFRCGKSVPEGGVCPYCGQDLSAASPATEAAPADSQASVPPAPLPEKKRRSVAGPLAVGAAAVLAAVCLALGGRRLVDGLPLAPLLTLCGVFALFFVGDLLGHKQLRMARSVGHWCLLALVTSGLLCACKIGRASCGERV